MICEKPIKPTTHPITGRFGTMVNILHSLMFMPAFMQLLVSHGCGPSQQILTSSCLREIKTHQNICLNSKFFLKQLQVHLFVTFSVFIERSDPTQQITTITNHGLTIYIYIYICKIFPLLKQIAKNQKRILKFCSHFSTHCFKQVVRA
jgi:hypothetical protein